MDAKSSTEVTTWSRHVPGLQLAWDATSLRSFATCPRRYQYEMVLGRRKTGGNADTTFGSRYHESLDVFDTARCAGDDVETASRKALMHALTSTWGWESDNPKKTRATLIRAVIWYCDTQRADGNVQPYAFPDGTPAVELSFRLPLGIENEHAEPYLLCGHMDSLATFAGQTFVRERKTTEKTLGSYFFDNYSPDPQIDTYSVAADVLFPELRIAGVLLEATQTAVGFARFHIQPLYRTPEQREEWLNEIVELVHDAERCARDQYWPRRTAVCGLYGGCPYRKVCGRSPSVRERFLSGDGYEERRWDPLETR